MLNSINAKNFKCYYLNIVRWYRNRRYLKKSKDLVQMSNIIDLVMHICESISLRQVQTAAMPDNVQMMYLKIIKWNLLIHYCQYQ